jgi:lipopolysaccharide biosynthesis glycosyltransferase
MIKKSLKFRVFASFLLTFTLVFGVFPTKILSNESQETQTSEVRNKIPVCYSTDNNYVYPTIVSITSLCENANPNTFYDIHIMISGDTTEENRTKLKWPAIKYQNCTIDLIDMGNEFKGCPKFHWGVSALYYLKLDSLLPETDKCIKLDGDTLVIQDLAELFNTNIDEYYVAGANNCLNKDYSDFLGIPGGKTINPGCLLINLKKIKAKNLQTKFLNYLSEKITKNKHCRLFDEDIINFCCYPDILILPFKYDVMTCCISENYKRPRGPYSIKELTKAIDNPVIVHYVADKPWRNISRIIRVRELQASWWTYAKKTPYFDEIIEKYVNPMKPKEKKQMMKIIDKA